ncbi:MULTISPECIES: YlmH/Sll1252 family protein [Caproicibacterium]|uniref:YlmH/Sll1252 family protein n=1 Tax=Caproicibacterium argilliputei TaxID=3030016 RepID=A0AA97D6N7_9FIRM|nr:YlmH/Sll1252 family protein [Caproicibacterium argilliputei]WOC31324.1 YlmH/Sll1252 family protein [Caproicibacterium argilliputei]
MDTEDTVLQAKIRDAVRLAQNGGGAHFVGFLDERGAALAKAAAAAERFSDYLLWGGFAEAERVCFGAFPTWMPPSAEAFPIQTVTADYRSCDKLTHRDFLGTLLAAGVSREVVGDILPEAGRCVFFLRRETADFLLTQIEKVGRVGVKFSMGARLPLPPAHTYAPFSATVASARLDCVAAACLGLSRGKTLELLRSGAVQVDHVSTVDADFPVHDGALLSVRGKGRFRIDAVSQPTAKGRLRLKGRKFI